MKTKVTFLGEIYDERKEEEETPVKKDIRLGLYLIDGNVHCIASDGVSGHHDLFVIHKNGYLYSRKIPADLGFKRTEDGYLKID